MIIISFVKVNYEDGITPITAKNLNDIQDEIISNGQKLDNKQNTITGAITPVLTSNFVTGRVIVSDSNGKLSANAITTNELSMLDGVTSNIQTQLDGKLPKSGGTMTGAINMGSYKITNLATPTNNADASTKKYVDDGLDGKAPSGYGLGTAAPYNSNVDNLYVGGFYRWDTDNSQTPFANGTMVVLPRNDGVRASQLAICNSGTGTGVIAVRSTKTDAVGEWLYVNPVMNPGTEYLTSEFWNNGKPVYKKLVSMGKLTTEFVEVAHGATLTTVVGVEAMAINETTKMSFPIAYSANDNVDDIGVYVNDTTVTFHNPQLLSAYKGYVIIKYVK